MDCRDCGTGSPLNFVRLAFAVVAFLVSLLAVIAAPTYGAWELSIAVTELGWIIAVASLIVFLPGWRRSRAGKIAGVFGGLAIVLALSPLVYAYGVARALPAEIRSAFGDAQPRRAPIELRDLIAGVRLSHTRIDSMTYAVRDGKRLDLDLYRPLDSAEKAVPIVVMIHGGSWRGGTRHDLDALNSYLAARGYAVAAISYRFAPQFPHPAASDDVAEAIHYLKSNASRLDLDSTRIALIGRSAGGQLALLAAYTLNDRSIRGAVGFYAPSDQVWGYDHPTNPRVINSTEILEQFLAGNPHTAPEAYRTASPVNFVGSSTPPTLLIHGAKDELVSVQQSDRLDARLSAAHRPHFFLRMPWSTHGCDYFFRGPCAQLSTYSIERFLSAVMR